jgi:hypothetical protein
VPPRRACERSNAQNEGFWRLEGRTAEVVTRWSGQRHNGDCESEVQMTTMEEPASTRSFDQGTLTVHHLGKPVSLGRYAASSALRTLSKKLVGAPTANSSRAQIPPRLKRHR